MSGKSNLFSKLAGIAARPNAKTAAVVGGAAAGVAVLTQVAGTVARKRAERAEQKANGHSPQDQHVPSGPASQLPNLSGGAAPKQPRFNFGARQKAAAGVHGVVVDDAPVNIRQAREQLAAWADVAMQHVTAYQASMTNLDGTSKLSEVAQDYLWKDIEYVGQMAGEGREVMQTASLDVLVDKLNQLKQFSDGYAHKLPASKQVPPPLTTGPGVAGAAEALDPNSPLGQEFIAYGIGVPGMLDIRDPQLAPRGTAERIELGNAVSAGVGSVVQLRAVARELSKLSDDEFLQRLPKDLRKELKALPETERKGRLGQLRPSEAQVNQYLYAFAEAFRNLYDSTEADLKAAIATAKHLQGEIQQTVGALNGGQASSGGSGNGMKTSVNPITGKISVK